MIIDAKGRLFGKVNVVDLFVVIVLLALIPVLYFGYKAITEEKEKVAEVKREFIDMEIPCKLVKLAPDTLRDISVGDKEVNKDGKTIAQIVSMGEPATYEYVFDIGEEDPFVLKKTLMKFLPVKLRLRAEVKGKNIYYKDIRVANEQPFEFETAKYTAEVVPDIVIPKVERWITVKIRFSSLSQEIGPLINEGHIERDIKGRVIGKLQQVLDVSATKVSALKLDENKFVYINDPFRSDIETLMDLLCTEKDGILYYKNSPIKIGSQINFSSDIYIVNGMIIGIEGK